MYEDPRLSKKGPFLWHRISEKYKFEVNVGDNLRDNFGSNFVLNFGDNLRDNSVDNFGDSFEVGNNFKEKIGRN